jgi:hypothetical protein
MAGYQRCISLALVCLLLYHCSQEAEAYESTARIDKTGTFEHFRDRHFIDGTPDPKIKSWWDDNLGIDKKMGIQVHPDYR